MTTHLAEQLRASLRAAPTNSRKVAVLFDFVREHGQTRYDESVTQLQHALQSAQLASEEDLGAEAVTAALFHDLGHLLVGEHDQQSEFLAEDLVHEDAGAAFLQEFFPTAVTEPVRLHVVAKRYLCTTESDYYDGLSAASQRSFQLQGGRLSDEEKQQLESNEHLQLALALRRIDDRAKAADKSVPDLNCYSEMVGSVMLGSPS